MRDRSGHDMNYLGLVGLLGLTGDAGGPPVQAAGQIADLGGGALMAAFGILAALRERDRSGEGQLVDVSMADGALSWLAMVAARYLAEDVVPRRGDLELAGSLVCYRPYACADGWVTLGALEPKFWQAWCRGVGREDLVEHQFARAGSEAHREVEAIFHARTREEWRAFASEHDCCLEPVLDLDEALDSELVRAREMVVELDQPGAQRPVRLLGVPVKLSRTPGDANRAPGPGLGEHTREVLAGLGYGPEEIAALLEVGCRRGSGGRSPGVVPLVNEAGLLKMSELAERSGVSAGTIKHYLREGLLGEGDEIVRTSRNMAYYPPEYVERIRLIKRLQEDRFMPLRVIKDRIVERAVEQRESERVSAAEARRRYEIPRNVLDRLAELGVLTPSLTRLRRRRREDHRGDLPLPGRAATTSSSGSPSSTPCATAMRSSRSCRRRSGCCSIASPARSRSSARWRSSRRAPSRCATSSARCTRSSCSPSCAAGTIRRLVRTARVSGRGGRGTDHPR